MGWFDGLSVVSDDPRRHSSSHRKHHSSSASFFGLGSDHHKQHNSSRSSFFGGRSSSYYKRSPRKGYINKIFHQLRRLLRDLIYYMKKHPIKVFVLVIMPLITGGALTGLLRQFGVRLPHGVEKMFGSGGGHGSTGIGRGRNGELQFERESYEGPLGGMGGIGNVMGGASGLMSIAKMFM